MTFHEDATRMTVGAAGRILSIVHDLVLGLLKRAGFTNAAKGRRWFEGHFRKHLLCFAQEIPFLENAICITCTHLAIIEVEWYNPATS